MLTLVVTLFVTLVVTLVENGKFSNREGNDLNFGIQVNNDYLRLPHRLQVSNFPMGQEKLVGVHMS